MGKDQCVLIPEEYIHNICNQQLVIQKIRFIHLQQGR